MHLRLIERRDLEAVRRLRNENREWFFDDGEVTPAGHERWFESLSTRPVRFYVIEEDGEVVGTISVTERDDGLELGNVLLDARSRGRGLMHRALEQLTSEPGRYYGLVRPENRQSLNVFVRAGFTGAHVRLERVVP